LCVRRRSSAGVARFRRGRADGISAARQDRVVFPGPETSGEKQGTEQDVRLSVERHASSRVHRACLGLSAGSHAGAASRERDFPLLGDVRGA
jgi:hypothetical protein